MSAPKQLTILQLYAQSMNIYGDWGNVLVLKKRAEWHGYTVRIIEHNVGDAFTEDVDIIVGGGGQDSGQLAVQADLKRIAPQLKKLADDGTPMLLICGLYQLFGRFFKTSIGEIIEGIGLLDLETHAGPERLIGNTILMSEQFGEIIGYENHSGQTFLAPGSTPLGTVILGAGNNGHDQTEGVRYKNIIGTYLHGSLLPKNPRIADFLIEQAATKRYGSFTPGVIDDSLVTKARAVAKKRPR